MRQRAAVTSGPGRGMRPTPGGARPARNSQFAHDFSTIPASTTASQPGPPGVTWLPSSAAPGLLLRQSDQDLRIGLALHPVFDLQRRPDPGRAPENRVIIGDKSANYYAGSGEEGQEAYGAQQAMEFTDQEKGWIKEVFSLNSVRILFFAYSKVPTVVLHRLKQIQGGKSTRGEYTPGKRRIAIDEEATKPQADLTGMGITSAERLFKKILIHELIHFFEDQVKKDKDKLVPQNIRYALENPEQAGFRKYEFGWFVVNDVPLNIGEFETNVPIGPDMVKIMEKVKEVKKVAGSYYEKPPTGHAAENTGEDLADTMALYMLDDASRAKLKAKWPSRFRLMENYFGQLIQYVKQGGRT
jgi:hypothetical protein